MTQYGYVPVVDGWRMVFPTAEPVPLFGASYIPLDAAELLPTQVQQLRQWEKEKGIIICCGVCQQRLVYDRGYIQDEGGHRAPCFRHLSDACSTGGSLARTQIKREVIQLMEDAGSTQQRASAENKARRRGLMFTTGTQTHALVVEVIARPPRVPHMNDILRRSAAVNVSVAWVVHLDAFFGEAADQLWLEQLKQSGSDGITLSAPRANHQAFAYLMTQYDYIVGVSSAGQWYWICRHADSEEQKARAKIRQLPWSTQDEQYIGIPIGGTSVADLLWLTPSVPPLDRIVLSTLPGEGQPLNELEHPQPIHPPEKNGLGIVPSALAVRQPSVDPQIITTQLQALYDARQRAAEQLTRHKEPEPNHEQQTGAQRLYITNAGMEVVGDTCLSIEDQKQLQRNIRLYGYDWSIHAPWMLRKLTYSDRAVVQMFLHTGVGHCPLPLYRSEHTIKQAYTRLDLAGRKQMLVHVYADQPLPRYMVQLQEKMKPTEPLQAAYESWKRKEDQKQQQPRQLGFDF